ncbi:hypothetical protein [Micromonospora sp. RP3T]|uniref:hypothetical protein n=1 Tax=Micromonospora sp. RP3T TaxID=2135446 RepID=UPI003D73D30A
MTPPPIRLVLDVTALRAYVAGSVHVGEVLHEVVEDGRFAVPVPVAVEALATTTGKDLAALHRLFGLERCALLADRAGDLIELTHWRRLTGRADMAAAAVAALTHDAAVLTADGRRYGLDVPLIHVPA